MYPFFNVFGRTVGTYGLLAVTGALVCVALVCVAAKPRGVMAEDIILLFLSVGAGAFAGGHLLYGFTHLPELFGTLAAVSSQPLAGSVARLGAIFGGMVFYGGLFGGIAAIAIHTHFSGAVGRGTAYDILAVAVPLFHVFGRIGCFLGGCCYGIECSLGFTARGNTLSPGVNDVSRFPVQLLESALNLILFCVLYRMFRHNTRKGRLIFVYLPGYALIRFCTEFLRGDSIRGFVGIFSTSQLISLMIIAFCLVRAAVLFFRPRYGE